MVTCKDGRNVHVEIYWSDLTQDAQRQFEEVMGDNGNTDVIPLMEIDYEEDEPNGTDDEL